jgi:hypothetical protein
MSRRQLVAIRPQRMQPLDDSPAPEALAVFDGAESMQTRLPNWAQDSSSSGQSGYSPDSLM